MANKLTIQFHLKHYKDSGLSFLDYMVVLLYEQKNTWTTDEIGELLSVAPRTAHRMRIRLAHGGFLKKENGIRYSLTDKLYAK